MTGQVRQTDSPRAELWIFFYLLLTQAAALAARGLLSGNAGDPVRIPAADALQSAALLGLTAALLRRLRGRGAAFGLCRPQNGKRLLWGLPLAVPVSASLWFGAALPTGRWVLPLLTLLLAALLEELLFRGLLFRQLERAGVRQAALVSALIFALLHGPALFRGGPAEPVLLQMGCAMAAGWLFAWLVRVSGSLLPGILAHCGINALSVFAAPVAEAPGPRRIIAAGMALSCLLYGLYLRRQAR